MLLFYLLSFCRSIIKLPLLSKKEFVDTAYTVLRERYEFTLAYLSLAKPTDRPPTKGLRPHHPRHPLYLLTREATARPTFIGPNTIPPDCPNKLIIYQPIDLIHVPVETHNIHTDDYDPPISSHPHRILFSSS